MFESLKKMFWTSKSNDFYPVLNSAFGTEKELSKKDYLTLYTGWAYTCIDTIWDSVSDLEYKLFAGKEKVREKEHKHLNLITPALLKSIVAFLKLNWSAFVYMEKIWKSVVKLNMLRPDLVKIKQNKDWSVSHYEYSTTWWNYRFEEDEIMAFYNFDPLESYPYKTKWYSTIQAVAIQMEMDVATTKWNWNFFKNNASLGWFLKSDQSIDEWIKRRMLTAWNNNYQGVNNSHKVWILDWGLEYQPISANQREMDFVEQRKFTRDEVLAIFKVPKAIIGMWEWVNVWNVEAFEKIFAKRTIKPLATMIANILNEKLFKNLWIFEFVNVVPEDTVELRADLEAGAITINEYRSKRWFKPLKEWNILKLNEFQVWGGVSMENDKKTVKNELNIEKTLKKHTKGTDEYMQKKWEEKIARNNKYEDRYNRALQKIFNVQEEDILKSLKTTKTKKIRKPKFEVLKYLTLYHSLIWPIQKELVEKEWQLAMDELNLEAMFVVWDPKLNKYLRDNIHKFAKEIDNTTKNNILRVIEQGNDEWLWAAEITRNVTRQFTILKTSRAEKIVRTETIRAWWIASQEAWEQSEVVEWKEWWTAIDERVCKYCWNMHWKRIWLKDNFLNKWDTFHWLKLDYEDVKTAPLHTNCRCSLIPITEYSD